MNANYSIKCEKCTNISYPKNEILSTINEICKKGKEKYKIKNANYTFGTIKISTVDGFIFDITLSEINDNKTAFTILAHSASGSKATQEATEETVDYFLKLVDMRLRGENVTLEVITGKKDYSWVGCIIGVIIVLLMIGTIVYFYQ